MDNPETQSKDKLNKNTASLHLPLYCFTRSVSQMTKGMFHFPVLSSFMTYQRVCNYINTTDDTSGAGTAYPSWGPEFTPIVSGVRVTRSLVLYVCFVDRCLSFCPFSFGHCVACSSSIYGF